MPSPRIAQLILCNDVTINGVYAMKLPQAEWGGKFRVPISLYLPRSLVEAAVEKGVMVRPRLRGVQYLAFTDPASGTGTDSFTMGIGHRSRDGDRDVLIIDALWEARPPFSAIDVVKGHADALKQWGLSEIMGDDYGGRACLRSWASVINRAR